DGGRSRGRRGSPTGQEARPAEILGRGDLDVLREPAHNPYRVAEALDEHRVVGADDAVAPRLLVRLAEEVGAERLWGLDRPELRAIERRLHPRGAHPLDRLRDRQGTDRRTLRGGRAHDGVDEVSRDQRT